MEGNTCIPELGPGMMLGCPSVLCAGVEALGTRKAHNSAPWIVLHCAWPCPEGHVGLLGHPHLPHNTCPRYMIGHHSYFSMPQVLLLPCGSLYSQMEPFPFILVLHSTSPESGRNSEKKRRAPFSMLSTVEGRDSSLPR